MLECLSTCAYNLLTDPPPLFSGIGFCMPSWILGLWPDVFLLAFKLIVLFSVKRYGHLNYRGRGRKVPCKIFSIVRVVSRSRVDALLMLVEKASRQETRVKRDVKSKQEHLAICLYCTVRVLALLPCKRQHSIGDFHFTTGQHPIMSSQYV